MMVNGVRIVFFSLSLDLLITSSALSNLRPVYMSVIGGAVGRIGAAYNALPSSKSISFLLSLYVDNIFKTWRMSELAPLISSSRAFGGIFSFSLALISLTSYAS